jgi:acetyl-CoA carboxylase carboxyltransferase component
MALEWRIPFIRLLDQAGGSIRILENENEPLFRGSGYGVCLPVALMSQVPVVSAVLGSVAGLPAVWAAEAHWNIMTKNTSEVFVAGPPVVDRAFHLRTTKVELGGYKVQAYQSGVIDNVAEDEEDLFRQIRLFLSYLPENVWQQPPRVEGGDAPTRREEELLSIIPKDSKKVYDIRQLISHIVDKDSIFELSPFFGRSFVTILARMDGYPVAIMSNDCRWFGGAQTAAACEKMTRFVDLADTFHIPVVYLVDVPGFMIGVDSEKEGTLRKAARLWFAVHQATVPWVSVIIRRCYGVAGGVRNRRTGLNFTYAWPSSRRGPLPLEGGVMAAYRQEIETATDPEARRIEIEKRIERASSWARFAGTFDNTEVIDPRDTRPLLCQFVRDAWQVTATQLGPKLRGIRP